MSVYTEIAMCQLLDSDAAVFALRNNRIYPDMAQQDAILPYQVYTRIDNPHEHHLLGASGLCHPRIQLDCYAKTKGEARKLMDVSRLVLDGFRGTVPVQTEDGGAVVHIQACRLASDNDEFVPPSDASGVGVYRSSMDFEFSVDESIPIR